MYFKPKHFWACLYMALFLVPIFLQAQTTEWYKEDFDNNNDGWYTTDNDNTYLAVKDGAYYIRLKKEEGGTWSYFSGGIFIDPKKDYILETHITQQDGVDNYGFGLLWASNGYKDNYMFSISSNGYFKVAKYVNNVYSDIKPWEKIGKKVNKRGENNKLAIHRRSGQLYFYVNDNEVYNMPDVKPMGPYIGFNVQNKMTIAVDNVVLKQDNVIKLPQNLVTGYKKENLGESVNTKYSEKSPRISPDGKTLWYSIQGDPNNSGGVDDGDEIYYSALNGEAWTPRKRMGYPLNNSYPNSVISVTPDNNFLLLSNTYKEDGSPKGSGFSTSYRTPDGWSVPKDVVVENYYNRGKYIESCLSADRKTLLMAIQRDDTYGDRDIYASFLKEDGTWTAPKNLGGTVNSFGEEMSPYLAADGVTMYFSTNGRPGYGSNDVYVTRRLDDSWTNWSEPENLGPDVNTKSWDAYYVLPANGKYAYMVSSESGFGKGDIFRIEVPNATKPKPVVLIYGKVLNSKTKDPLGASISYRDLTTDKELGLASSDPANGDYKIILPAGTAYSFLASKESFISVSENFDVSKLEKYIEIKRDLYLAPIEVGSTVRLNNIFFDFGKTDLRPQSYPDLNRLVKVLEQNPNMVIEIGGHTDNVGSDENNLKLSQSRSDAVRKYLLDQGITAERITAQGYGESKPQADNETEEGRQLNRRVEFTIIKN